ncbi:3-methyl-2-oxobutanoate hydroxymethyltransferase [Candidatus Termititenax dinenymphae]|uniref:3-methyl-2-oxobutanoate hydroxymethyltransferase n=1 Tax=Candidatus Termititenax dinenymphae TaxID=2218523 RepID=A0A388TKR6_9BACT|nr:3-methyl-2-oxobutanoate hydroxymethyltransferase [Candidatus Termititenax dinenymphae]
METVAKLLARKNKEKITMLTVYSASIATVLNNTDIDMLLIGDSLGTVFQGKKDTISVTLEEMIYHGSVVRRGAPDKFLVVDLPFMSYQVNAEESLINAGQIMKQTGANAVKLEGASAVVLESIRKMTAAGIPVVAHLGFTPQSVNGLSGYKVQGKDDPSAEKIKSEAKLVETAGAFMVTLEMVPAKLAKEITQELSIPTIGIGAGADCDGQVLVIDDMLGLYPGAPKFVKRYADLDKQVAQAAANYIKEVKAQQFPDAAHSF